MIALHCSLPRETDSSNRKARSSSLGGTVSHSCKFISTLQYLKETTESRPSVASTWKRQGLDPAGGLHLPALPSVPPPFQLAAPVSRPAHHLYCTVLYCNALYCTVLYQGWIFIPKMEDSTHAHMAISSFLCILLF